MIFAGALWLLVPFAIVMPGIMAFHLYPDALATNPDKAYPTLIANLLPSGFRGFLFAALAGAVTSSLASMLNSASTILTIDIYQRLIRPDASQKSLVLLGRLAVVVFIVIACSLAPRLADPKFGGVFLFIQQFQGYIWPGVVAAFTFGILVEKAPPAAGVLALVAGPALYGLLQLFAPNLHFLIQVAVAFNLLLALMGLVTFWFPLEKPKTLPRREDLDVRTQPWVKLLGGLVIAGVAVFVAVFW